MQQYSFRSDDDVLRAGVEHEQSAAKCSRSAAVLALVLEGLAFRRWRREQEAIMVYKSAQEVEHGEGEEHG